MSYDGEAIYTKDNKTDYLWLILIHSLDEYKKKFGQEKLLELSERCPLIKNHKKELDEFNTQQFMLWLLHEKILGEINAAQRAGRLAAIFELLSALEDEMKRAFDKQLWERDHEEYLKEMAAQMWRLLNTEEQERLKKAAYSMLLEFYKNMISNHIIFLTQVRDSLARWVACERKIIDILKIEDASSLRDLIAMLPKMPALFEEKRQFIMDEINNFINSNVLVPISVLLNKISSVIDEITHHILDPMNEYSPDEQSLVPKIESVAGGLKVIHRREEVADKVEACVQDYDDEIKRSKKALENPSEMGNSEMLKLSIKQITGKIKEQNKSIDSIVEQVNEEKISNKNLTQYSVTVKEKVAALQVKKENAIGNAHQSLQGYCAINSDFDFGANEPEAKQSEVVKLSMRRS